MTDPRSQLDAIASARELPSTAASRLWRLVELVAGDEHAPTAVREPTAAVERHIADSLAGLEVDALKTAKAIADIGSGAGFPALPLAIALPSASVWMVESSARKIEFLRRAARAAGADNAHPVHARAEEWHAPGDGCDVVTARALASLPVVLEYAAPLLRTGGSVVAWRGRRDADEEAAASAAARELGLEPGEIRAVRPFAAATDRHLHVFTKAAATPERFPRRPGMAAKRPLGG
jgi:16S rRNA (guanine527-N7)-methyltransferase